MLIDPLEPRRLLAAGDPIESFGQFGVASFSGPFGRVSPAQVLPLTTGKVLFTADFQYDYSALPMQVDFVRFNADGSLDNTFGTAGTVDTFLERVEQAIELPGGKVLALGKWNWGSFLIRLNTNGTLDTGFGTGGRIELHDQIGSARLFADGSVMGMSNYPDIRVSAVVRYRPDGTLDPGFGQGGRAVIYNYRRNLLFSTTGVCFGDAGDTYLAGTRPAGRGEKHVIRRLAPDGTLDATFATTSEIQLRDGSATRLFAVQDGWIATTSISENGIRFGPTSLVMLKFSDAGVLDQTFGVAGVATEPIAAWGTVDQLIEQPDGKLVTFGTYDARFARDLRMGRSVRYNPDGTRDPSYGEVLLPAGSATRIAMATDGNRILVGNENRVTALAVNDAARGPFHLYHTGTLSFVGTPRSERMRIDIASTYVYPGYVDTGYVGTRDAWARVLPLVGVRRVVMDAGAGNDLLIAPLTGKPVTLIGGTGDDKLRAGYLGDSYRVIPADDVVLSGGPGDDDILFYGNAITATGNDGNDRIVGNALIGAPSVIRGGAGNDYIWTSGPRRTHAFDLFGDAGNDHITSGGSFDLLDGGADRDTLLGDTHDTLRAGEA